MGQHLAKLGTLFLVGGCSLIYNPDKLPDQKPIDAAPDSMIDANPAAVAIDSVFPTEILEGTGTGGSRKAIVVLKGHDFATDGSLAVSFTPSDVVTIEAIDVASTFDYVALTITAPVDETHGATDPAQGLAITLTQNGAPAPVMLDNTHLKLTYLDELKSPAVPAPGTRYSKVELTATLAAPASTTMKDPLTIDSVSSISIMPGTNNPAVTANASGRSAGMGGCPGGAAKTSALCPGNGGGVGANGVALAGGGGGGGLVTNGVDGTNGGTGGMQHGDAKISSLAANVPGAGGGGSGGSATGGGGGGIVQLVAGGDVTIAGDIEANGGNGAGGGLNGGGGGGAGGVILVRAGGTLMMTGGFNINRGGGGSGTGGGGGPGSEGRTRWDAAAISGTAPSSNNHYVGPMIKTAPYVARTAMSTIMVAGKPSDMADGRVYDAGNQPGTPFTVTFGGGAAPASGNATPTLVPGYNRVCVTVAGGDASFPESTNCIEMVYLP